MKTKGGKPGKSEAVAVRASALSASGGAAALLGGAWALILGAHQSVATAVNAVIAQLYLQIGPRIHGHILRDKRAEFGRKVVAALPRELAVEFGRVFSVANLSRVTALAEGKP